MTILHIKRLAELAKDVHNRASQASLSKVLTFGDVLKDDAFKLAITATSIDASEDDSVVHKVKVRADIAEGSVLDVAARENGQMSDDQIASVNIHVGPSRSRSQHYNLIAAIADVNDASSVALIDIKSALDTLHSTDNVYIVDVVITRNRQFMGKPYSNAAAIVLKVNDKLMLIADYDDLIESVRLIEG